MVDLSERPRLSVHYRQRGPALVRAALIVGAVAVLAGGTLLAHQVSTGRTAAGELAPFFLVPAVLVLSLVVLGRRRIRAVDLVFVLGAVLLLFPAQFRISQLGAVGAPGALVGLAAFALWTLGLTLRRPWMAARRHPLRWALLGLALSVMASFIAASYRPIDGLEARAAIRGLIIVVVMAGMALAVSDILRTRLAIRQLVKVLVLCGSVVSLLGVVQFRTGIDLATIIQIPGFTYTPEDYSTERSGFVRIVSTTTNPLELSVVLAILLPLALYLAFTESRWRQKFWFVNSALIALGIPMTVSRTGIVAVAIGLSVMMLGWTWRRRWGIVLAGIVGVAAMRLAIPGLVGTIQSYLFTPGEDTSIKSRERGVLAALQFFADRPIFGRGFATYLPDRYVFLDNQVLLSSVETGVVGLLALFGLMATGAALGLGIRRAAHGAAAAHDRELALALLAGVTISTVVLFTFDALTFPTSRGLTMVFLGMVAALWRIVRNDADRLAARRQTESTRRDRDEPTSMMRPARRLSAVGI